MKKIDLLPSPLTKADFAPFGQVIDQAGCDAQMINNGAVSRFSELATVEATGEGARIAISIFQVAEAIMPPVSLSLMERHPLGSQSFMPLSQTDWFVIVCEGRDVPDISTLRCFHATGTHGVNIARNVWHHPLLCREIGQSFLVVDRTGEGNNLEEVSFDELGIECWIEP